MFDHIEIGFGIHHDIASPTAEIARILRAIANDIESDGVTAQAIYDSAGRFVGEVKISGEEEGDE